MDPQKRIDKILDAVETRIQEEVGGLLGVEFTLIGGNREPATKEDAFDDLLGKQVCAKMDITGDVSGEGCLLMGIKDAIRLGGTLVMLPASELEEVMGREEYNEEIEDSYGEIANIIAGSFTTDFEEMYPKSLRFVRKEQEVLHPAKVDIESDEPVKKQTYYRVVFSMVLDGKQMGDLIMLMPTEPFELTWDDATTGGTEKETEAEPPASEEASDDASPSTDSEVTKPSVKIDAAKQKKRVDRILSECEKRLSDEMTALLGVDVLFSDQRNQFINKEDFFFEHASGKQVIADLEVVGDREDSGYFSINLKDAIHLGGVLIMLPPSELENVVTEEDFGDDGQDAYGEVANILSGVYTAVFEEQYNENIRFIRKELHKIVPLKVDVESDTPFANRTYYVSSMSLTVDGKQLGDVHMIIPADMLHLESIPEENDVIDDAVDGKSAQQTNEQTDSDSDTIAKTETDKAGEPEFDFERHRKRVDKLLESCRLKVAEEVGAMLAVEVTLDNMENKVISKEDFFYEEVSGKQILANLDIVGDIQGKSYLSVNVKDAIRIGGVLIMLPASELDAAIAEESFSEDAEDAYGEIANIISGVYTAVFEEGYTKSVRFVKTELLQILPMKVDIESDEPVENQDYYLSSMDLTIDGNSLGKVNFILPAELMQIADPVQEEVQEQPIAEKTKAETTPGAPGAENTSQSIGKESERQSVDILLVSDNVGEAEKIMEALSTMGYFVKSISFQDDVQGYIPGELKAIYLVMEEVNELAFGAAIKISSSCTLPLIAAGSGWTKSKVIKAMKYGVQDILLTPASQDDVKENVANNLMKLAA